MRFNEELFIKYQEFNDYVHSNNWKSLKNLRLNLDGGCCAFCKSNKRLICHHITYERIFHEDIEDLVILCCKCHSKIHKFFPKSDIPDFVKQNALDIVYEVTPEDVSESMNKIFGGSAKRI